MAFNYAAVRHVETTVEGKNGPFETDAGRFMWIDVDVQFRLPEGTSPHVTLSVTVEMPDNNRTWAEIEAEALASAKILLQHPALTTDLRVVQRE